MTDKPQKTNLFQRMLQSKTEISVATPTTRSGLLARLTRGLQKSTNRLSENMTRLLTQRKLDPETLADLQDMLIASDFGVTVAQEVCARLSDGQFDKQISPVDVKTALAGIIYDYLVPLEKPLIFSEAKPQIMLFVGVNGSGKTTTLGKLAQRYKQQGKKILLVAGDTFRAAASEQLTVWADRAGVPIMQAGLSAKGGSDAAGLVYAALARARQDGFDLVMIDTAGRLQNRRELMDELAKIVRVIKKQDNTAPHHTILVLDATVGQNALSQIEAFTQTAQLSGLIMTKLDGTAKGGILVALAQKYTLPVHAIGIGEQVADLEDFSALDFAQALTGTHQTNSPQILARKS